MERRESTHPARTALSLVLDGGDGTLGSPVDRGSSNVVEDGGVGDTLFK